MNTVALWIWTVPWPRPFLFLLFTLCSLSVSLLSTHAYNGTHTFSHLSPENSLSLVCSVCFSAVYAHKQSLILPWTSWKIPVWIYCCKFSLNASLSPSLCLISAQRRVHVLKVCSYDSTSNRTTQTNLPDPLDGINVFPHKSCWCLFTHAFTNPTLKTQPVH